MVTTSNILSDFVSVNSLGSSTGAEGEGGGERGAGEEGGGGGGRGLGGGGASVAR